MEQMECVVQSKVSRDALYTSDLILTRSTVMNDEIQTSMRLMGVTSLEQLNPSYVNTSLLEQELPRFLDIPGRSATSKL